MRILKEECIALAIDFQEKLLPIVAQKEELQRKSVTLLTGLQILNIPIIVTEQYPKGLGQTVPEIQAALASYSPYDKITFSACQNAKVQEAIRASGKKTVLLFGIEAHICVLQTLIDLIADGYRVVLVTDAISSRNPADKECALARAQIEGALPATVECLLFELANIAGTSEFKKISALVK